MLQFLGLFACLSGGALLCVIAVRAITLHYRLPWRQALMYFGVVPYPNESPPPRPPRP